MDKDQELKNTEESPADKVISSDEVSEKKPSSGKKKVFIALGAIVLVVIAVGAIIYASNQKTSQDNVAAVVNGVPITMDEFDKEFAAMEESYAEYANEEEEVRTDELKQITIDQMIDNELARQMANEAGVTVADEDFQEQYDYVLSAVGGEDELATMLEEQGMTDEELRDQINTWLLTQAYIEQEIGSPEVTDAEVEEDYNANQADYTDEDGNVMAFDDVKDQVREALVADKQNELFNEKLDEFREKSTIDIFVVDETATSSSGTDTEPADE